MAPLSTSPADMPPRNKALILILFGAAFVRIYGLWLYLPTMDEIQFMIISQGHSFADIWARAQAEVHPPLSWFIRHFTLIITGDLFLQRLLSVIFGLVTVIGAYALGKASYHDKRAGLLCAFLMAFLPASVISSMGLRNYPFLMLFLLWALVFFLRWQRKGRLHNLALYTGFIFCACACHFSAFIVAAACGLAQAAKLIRKKQAKALLLFCLSYLPLVALSLVFYAYYLAPGTTIPMWKNFMLETGFTSAQPETGLMPQLVIPLLAYFSPFLQAVHSPGFISAPYVPMAQILVLSGGVVLMALYAAGLYRLRRIDCPACKLVVIVWLIALILSFADLYPFSANRHNMYLLPFFILPLAGLYRGEIRLPRWVAMIALAIAIDEAVIWRDEDFCLKKEDYAQGQNYLKSQLAPGDIIVTGPMGAYFYLIYDYDQGKTPYNDYGDKPYVNGSTLLAPFASPYKPYHSWQPFRDDLEQRLNAGMGKGGAVWFVQYGWKNQELWALMQCKSAQPLMEHFMSRDGVVIFSMKAAALSGFLKDTAAWDACYADYKPLVIGTPFRAIAKP